MGLFQKHQLAKSLIAGAWLGLVTSAFAQSAPASPESSAGSATPPLVGEAPEEAARLDVLFAKLRQPGREDWEKIEEEIGRIWAHSGSQTADLLLERGQAAIEREDYVRRWSISPR